MEQFIGKRIGPLYRVKALLGQQSGRRTFLAENENDHTAVVVKLVLFGPDFEWADLKLFEREAETLKSLDHPAIPRYLDSFEVDTPLGKGFALVQTYIEAKTLEAWVVSGRQFEEADLQPIARALLSILFYLHSCYPAVVHRDIKPSNILLSEASAEGPAKLYLVDFGSVQATKKDGTMTIVGTYGYMPPEQFSGRSHPASDLYSLGATLIYLATGKHPAELTQDNLTIEFESLVRLSPSFTQWLRRITETDLSKRTASAQQALNQLTQSYSKGQSHRSHTASTLNKESLVVNTVVAPPFEPFEARHCDFLACGTPDTLEIECLRSRILEPLRVRENMEIFWHYVKNYSGSAAEIFTALSKNITLWLSFSLTTGLLLVFCFSAWGPGLLGSVAYTLIFWFAVPQFWMPLPEIDKDTRARLKLSRQQRAIILKLITIEENSTANNNASKPTIHFAEIPLHRIDVHAQPLTGTNSLCFSTLPEFSFGVIERLRYTGSKHSRRLERYPYKPQRLRITGTKQEIQWLTRTIARWRNLTHSHSSPI